MDKDGIRQLLVQKQGFITEEDEALINSLTVRHVVRIWEMLQADSDLDLLHELRRLNGSVSPRPVSPRGVPTRTRGFSQQDSGSIPRSPRSATASQLLEPASPSVLKTVQASEPQEVDIIIPAHNGEQSEAIATVTEKETFAPEERSNNEVSHHAVPTYQDAPAPILPENSNTPIALEHNDPVEEMVAGVQSQPAVEEPSYDLPCAQTEGPYHDLPASKAAESGDPPRLHDEAPVLRQFETPPTEVETQDHAHEPVHSEQLHISSFGASPEICEVDRGVESRLGSIGPVFNFREVKNTVKVHNKEGVFDYWQYVIELDTNLAPFAGADGGPDGVCGCVHHLTAHRRFGDFRFLNDALRVEHPGCILPPIPGFGLESKLDKVDTLLRIGAEDTPLFLAHRMQGLTLFLQWLADTPELRTSRLVVQLMTGSAQDFSVFEKQWRATRKSDTQRPDRGLHSMLFKVKKTFAEKPRLDPKVEQARATCQQLELHWTALKNNIEKFWDQLVDLHESFKPTVEVSLDPIVSVVHAISAEANKASHLLAKDAEKVLMDLATDANFCVGILASAKGVVDHLEDVAIAIQKGQMAETRALYLTTTTEAFLRQYRELHLRLARIDARVCKGLIDLPYLIDPSRRDWEEFSRIIDELD